MKFSRLVLLAIVCWVVFFASNTRSQAEGFGRGHFYGGLYGLYGYNLHDSLYARGYIPIPPYFALHPPVYYGERYARPYGASPFASKGQLQANESYRHRIRTDFVPMKIDNPYCPGCKAEATPAEPTNVDLRTAATPQIIENPFYYADGSDAQPAKLVHASPEPNTSR